MGASTTSSIRVAFAQMVLTGLGARRCSAHVSLERHLSPDFQIELSPINSRVVRFDYKRGAAAVATALELIHRVGSPYVGTTLDITHFNGDSDEDMYKQIEARVPYATQTHIRDHFNNLNPIDLDRVWQIFVRHGHRDYITLEYAANGDPLTDVPRRIELMKEFRCNGNSSVCLEVSRSSHIVSRRTVVLSTVKRKIPA
jgi:hypothetical protein